VVILPIHETFKDREEVRKQYMSNNKYIVEKSIEAIRSTTLSFHIHRMLGKGGVYAGDDNRDDESVPDYVLRPDVNEIIDQLEKDFELVLSKVTMK